MAEGLVNPFAGIGETSTTPPATMQCPCPEAVTAPPTPPLHRQHFLAYELDHWGLIIGLALEVALVLGLYIYHRKWLKRQMIRAKKSGVVKQSQDYAQSLVRSMLPSMRVERHRFRGLKRKSETLSIEFEDLGLKIANGSTVLAGVTGGFDAGRMCAIMGPSGAGKTTFMNVLCGKATYGTMTGNIRINGQEGDISLVKSVMGFVPQDDIVHEPLTVSEQIYFSAQLRGPPNLTPKRTEAIVEDVLSVMQIDHIRNSIVGGVENRGISGGQRKRVNIGLELAADPTLLFLDEPTSGLDSTSSLTVIHSIKKLTELGMTAIMVIHQPRYSLFTLFDDVLLLGKGGRTVYLGSSQGAKGYFESIGFKMPADENPADWFMDVISGEVQNEKIPNFQPPMLFDLWEQHQDSPEVQRTASKGRQWTKKDDRAALSSKLEEEWNKIDRDGDGVMDEDELRKLLTSVQGAQPDEEVVEELFRDMAEPGEDMVSKQGFLDYLCALQDSVVEEEDGSDSSEDSSSSDDEGGHLVNNNNNNARKVSAAAPSRRKVGCGKQFLILLHRRLIQWWRNHLQRFLFLGVIIFAAVILAVMDGFLSQEPMWSASPYLNLHTCLVLLTSVYCLTVFSDDRPVFWRERSNGLHVVAFFCARVIVNYADLLMQCYSFSSVYFLIRRMPYNFDWYFKPFLLASFAASGMGYFISCALPPQHGPFVAALVSFVTCGLLGQPLRVEKLEGNAILEAGLDITSITRWSVAMSFLKGIDEDPPQSLTFRDSMLVQQFNHTYRNNARWQEDLGYWTTGTLFLMAIAVSLHIFALICLIARNRDKAA